MNTDNSPNLATKYNIMYLPTLVVIKNGEEIDRSVGYIEKEEIQKLLEN